MITKHVDIDNNQWGVLLIYDFDTYEDEVNLAAIMRSFGVKPKKIDYALDVLSTYNSGMAISNFDLRMSVIFIGKTTSTSQFWNTISHEVSHVASAITEYYDKPCNGEDFAYLTGYILQCIVEKVGVPCK